MSNFFRRLQFATGCSFAFAFITNASAQDLSVCMIELKPWAFSQVQSDKTIKFVGIMPEIVSELVKRSGIQVRAKVMPYARVEYFLEHGSCDIALMAWSDRRSDFATKGTAFLALEFGVITVKDKSLKRYEDLETLTVSVARGLSVSPKFDADTTIRKETVPDNLTGIRQVRMKYVNAVAGSLLTLKYLIKEEGLNDTFGDSLVLKSNDFSAAFSKKSSFVDKHAEIDKIFAGMKSDGTVQRIFELWSLK